MSEDVTESSAPRSRAVLVALPMVVLYLLLQKQFIAGMTEGAVKG